MHDQGVRVLGRNLIRRCRIDSKYQSLANRNGYGSGQTEPSMRVHGDSPASEDFWRSSGRSCAVTAVSLHSGLDSVRESLCRPLLTSKRNA